MIIKINKNVILRVGQYLSTNKFNKNEDLRSELAEATGTDILSTMERSEEDPGILIQKFCWQIHSTKPIIFRFLTQKYSLSYRKKIWSKRQVTKSSLGIHTHTHTHKHRCTDTQTCTQTCTCTHVYIPVHMHTCTYVWTSIYECLQVCA